MFDSVCVANFSNPPEGVNNFLNKILPKIVFAKIRATTTTSVRNSHANWPNLPRFRTSESVNLQACAAGVTIEKNALAQPPFLADFESG